MDSKRGSSRHSSRPTAWQKFYVFDVGLDIDCEHCSAEGTQEGDDGAYYDCAPCTGTGTVTNSGSMVTINITTDGDSGFTTVQTYVGQDHTCTIAPGQLGDIDEYPEIADTHRDVYLHDGGDAYVAIHLDAVGYCDINGNFCE